MLKNSETHNLGKNIILFIKKLEPNVNNELKAIRRQREIEAIWRKREIEDNCQLGNCVYWLSKTRTMKTTWTIYFYPMKYLETETKT